MSIVSKYGNLHTINDEIITDTMLARFTALPADKHRDMWIRDAVAGDVGLYMDSQYVNKVIEVVMGSNESSVTTLFEINPIFFSRHDLALARKDLITEIGVATMSLPSNVAVWDEGRGCDVMLREMSTAQLIDLSEMAKNGKFGNK